MKSMFRHHYILDKNKNPTVEPDLMTWARWMENSDRHVGKTNIGPFKISTVFLGLDHNYSHKGPPVLFETMVFKKKTPGPKWNREDYGDLERDRCSGSWEQAEAMHQKMVALVKKKYKSKPRKVASK